MDEEVRNGLMREREYVMVIGCFGMTTKSHSSCSFIFLKLIVIIIINNINIIINQ